MSAESIALQLGTSVPVTTRESKVPIVTESPAAGWVTGDTGLKGVSKADFAPQALVAEELATIVPLPDAVPDDSDYPIWDAMRPLLARVAARMNDAADPAKALLLAAEMVGIDGYSATVHPIRDDMVLPWVNCWDERCGPRSRLTIVAIGVEEMARAKSVAPVRAPVVGAQEGTHHRLGHWT